jgi:hypothetical protein
MNAERLGKPPHNVVHEDETLLPTSSNRILFIVFVRGVRLSGYPVHRATAAGDTRRLGIPAHLPICLPHVHAPRQSARVTSGGSLLVSTPLAFLASVYGSGAYRAILNVFRPARLSAFARIIIATGPTIDPATELAFGCRTKASSSS